MVEEHLPSARNATLYMPIEGLKTPLNIRTSCEQVVCVGDVPLSDVIPSWNAAAGDRHAHDNASILNNLGMSREGTLQFLNKEVSYDLACVVLGPTDSMPTNLLEGGLIIEVS